MSPLPSPLPLSPDNWSSYSSSPPPPFHSPQPNVERSMQPELPDALTGEYSSMGQIEVELY